MLNRIVARLGILDKSRSEWQKESRRDRDPLRSDIAKLTEAVETLQATLATMAGSVADLTERQANAEHQAHRLRQIVLWNEKHHESLEALPRILDKAATFEHVRAAIGRAPLETDPFPHIVIENLLPAGIYKLLLRAIPPTAFFGGDAIKQNLRVPIDEAPALTCRVWEFIDEVVAREAIIPAVLEKFREPLEHHYDTIFGAAFRSRAQALPQASSGGRVMLRRPGYHLAPHRDPKRSMITCLMYLAKASDRDTYGTEVYRVSGDREASYVQTFYPEEHGCTCELVKVVPYRANSMLVFVNANGAHGAQIPRDAPADLERYAYQFYIGPGLDSLSQLIADLPPDRRAMWQDRKPDGLKTAAVES